jgi:TrmH RNA methyltransferase
MKHRQQQREIKVYGVHACLALFKQRPQDIIRVYCDESRVGILSPLLKWCAAHKKAYHIIPAEELAKVTQSIHHEGVCILAVQPEGLTFEDLLAQLPTMGKDICLLYLDGVQNPHNIGSILRVCAHFGVAYVLGERDKLPELTSSGYRIAKGGAESVQLIALPNPKQAFKKLKTAGFAFVGSSSHAKTSLYEYTFLPRTLLAFGAEGSGLSPALQKEVPTLLQIPGSGAVESLNVAIASALFLGEYWRQNSC